MLDTQGLTADETRGLTTSSARRSSCLCLNSTPIKLIKVLLQENLLQTKTWWNIIVMDDGDDKFIRKTKAGAEKFEYVNVEGSEASTDGDATVLTMNYLELEQGQDTQVLLHN